MIWWKFKEKQPLISSNYSDIHENILIRLKDSSCFPKYYVVYGLKKPNGIRYVEAAGEQSLSWKEDEIEAWASFKDIDKDFHEFDKFRKVYVIED